MSITPHSPFPAESGILSDVPRAVSGFEQTVKRAEKRLTRLRRSIYRTLWEVDERSLPRPRRALLTVVRLAFVTVDAFFRERLQMRAAALAFFTLLSIVPLAGLVFAVAKGVGLYESVVKETVRPFLHDALGGPGEQVPEGVHILRTNLDQVLDLVSGTDVVGLGVIGLLVLLVTAHRVVLGAEESFDAVWGYPGKRRLSRRKSSAFETTPRPTRSTPVPTKAVRHAPASQQQQHNGLKPPDCSSPSSSSWSPPLPPCMAPP